MGWNRPEHRHEEIHHRHHRTRRLCVGLCTILVVLIVLLGVATLITYLVLRPRTTHYDIVSARVPALAVSGTTSSPTSTSTVTAEFTYGVQARNPNGKVVMEYQKFNVLTTYLGTDIGHSSVPGFILGEKGSYVFQVTTSSAYTNGQVNNIVGNTLKADIASGSVNVQVKIDIRARAHIGGYTSFWMWLHTLCQVTVIPPSGSNPGVFVRSKCSD
ncbi:uncharacterized protein At1g08160 [Physcomitrium patens]|uniref:Uncharacterized protein n=1 Tax=Physcomitrium patens TaxID=3218 RepID=A0A2K1ITR6_PHYPA|nr:uncharacterized protein At1g08160-like [Physcomitrium patens]XP_024356959.1 uncharacterized protein At1g08160-like [Physcomitrium patens]XP_024356960.1 uncharacterized protein At1g08160-like [Physcomitrium patens]XP_024356961.1 uncharacterized protein At1g08160-like [Physcomitrium patens]PNR32673.1 hypothetical protein PHYPA_024615 [Physcomitrium patens]|eukprot:XP_024356958.1 uncharacterized protein At1g08160-like [Physcomitrella patens]